MLSFEDLSFVVSVPISDFLLPFSFWSVLTCSVKGLIFLFLILLALLVQKHQVKKVKYYECYLSFHFYVYLNFEPILLQLMHLQMHRHLHLRQHQ